MTAAQLEKLIEEGTELLSGEDAARVGVAHHRWTDAVRDWLRDIAPGSGLSAQWSSYGKSPLVDGGAYNDEPIVWAKHSDLVRFQLRWLSKNAPPLVRRPAAPESLWALLHPEIAAVSHERFAAGHYADAVEAALKHVNAVVKAIVVARTGKELDGASLMTHAFSPKDPIITLDDLSSQSGQDIQQGYMQLFAGAMTGIRNPKAHDNLHITAERAIHHLMLASLLLHRLSERVSPAA